jgi:hypothetical protein
MANYEYCFPFFDEIKNLVADLPSSLLELLELVHTDIRY